MKIKQPKEKARHKYIFPNFMAMAMKNVDMKTQLESAMMSMFLLLIGMILMSVYTLIYLPYTLVFKALVIFNIVAGFLFMTSYLITTYQQYNSYMAAVDVQNIMSKTPIVPRKKNRLNQFLFFIGLLILAGGVISYFMLENNPYRYYIAGGLGALGFLMIVSVFFRKPKNREQVQPISSKYKPLPKEKQQVLDNKLNISYDELIQNRELQQQEMGVSELMEQEITSEEDLDEMDREVLEKLEEEYPEEDDYKDYREDQNKRRFKGDVRYYR
jgi:hypothetical protein